MNQLSWVIFLGGTLEPDRGNAPELEDLRQRAQNKTLTTQFGSPVIIL
ncbi:MAG: hypothetical protein MGG11_04440 [Trichodesmium sp. MAG_R03]|nr:hypothetical protein [Trichodesmium sp. MAG_R03]